MSARSDLIFIALMVILMVWSDHVWLALLVACVHRTRASNQAIRRELYPRLFRVRKRRQRRA
jgi:hypothetical protein